jgi:hypothetical protein
MERFCRTRSKAASADPPVPRSSVRDVAGVEAELGGGLREQGREGRSQAVIATVRASPGQMGISKGTAPGRVSARPISSVLTMHNVVSDCLAAIPCFPRVNANWSDVPADGLCHTFWRTPGHDDIAYSEVGVHLQDQTGATVTYSNAYTADYPDTSYLVDLTRPSRRIHETQQGDPWAGIPDDLPFKLGVEP